MASLSEIYPYLLLRRCNSLQLHMWPPLSQSHSRPVKTLNTSGISGVVLFREKKYKIHTVYLLCASHCLHVVFNCRRFQWLPRKSYINRTIICSEHDHETWSESLTYIYYLIYNIYSVKFCWFTFNSLFSFFL